MCAHQHSDIEKRTDNKGRSFCRVCRNEAVNRHYHANRERKLQEMQMYYQDNLEAKRQYARDRYAADPVRVGAMAQRWTTANPYAAAESRLKRNMRRRARKLDQFIEDVDRNVVYEMHGGMCGICKEFVDTDKFEVDHVIPLSKGGMHGYVNVQPAHPTCNRRKGSKVL